MRRNELVMSSIYVVTQWNRYISNTVVFLSIKLDKSNVFSYFDFVMTVGDNSDDDVCFIFKA